MVTLVLPTRLGAPSRLSSRSTSGQAPLCRATRQYGVRSVSEYIISDSSLPSHSWSMPTGSPHQGVQRLGTTCRSAAAAAPPAPNAHPKLIDTPLLPIINNSGNIAPEIPAGSKQCVYAIYDDKQRLQYIGIAPELRNALRTCIGRRPEKAFFYRAVCLPSAEQEDGAALRDAWFEECGGAPKGNKMALERTAWTQPVESGAISERGKRAAAEQTAKALQTVLRERGCVEDFSPNPGLMDQGLVDFLAVEGISAAEAEAQRAEAAARAAQCRSVSTLVDGVEKKFLVRYDMKLPTRGGYMMDVVMTMDHKDTRHRIIAGRDYYEPLSLPPEAAVEAALAVIVSQKLARHTEGMLDSATFPVNYFCLAEVDQWYGEAFEAEYARITGAELADEAVRAEGFWRFNRTKDYTPMRLEKPDRMSDL